MLDPAVAEALAQATVPEPTRVAAASSSAASATLPLPDHGRDSSPELRGPHDLFSDFTFFPNGTVVTLSEIGCNMFLDDEEEAEEDALRPSDRGTVVACDGDAPDTMFEVRGPSGAQSWCEDVCLKAVPGAELLAVPLVAASSPTS